MPPVRGVVAEIRSVSLSAIGVITMRTSLASGSAAVARPFEYTSTEGEDARHHLTLYVESGRVRDVAGGVQLATGLRRIAQVHDGELPLTPVGSRQWNWTKAICPPPWQREWGWNGRKCQSAVKSVE
jgi:hypothetical protein